MKWPSERHPEVIGADVLDELDGPFVLWVIDGARPLVRRVVNRPVRIVRPGVDQPRRSGPPVALLVDESDVAEEHLSALHGVPVVTMAVRGSGRERQQVRFGRVLRPGADEEPTVFAARARTEANRLMSEETLGWWALAKGVAAPEPARRGWRRHWARTAPRQDRLARRAIWG